MECIDRTDCTATAPDFDMHAKPDQITVITIEGNYVAGEARRQFEPLGYTVYHGIPVFVSGLFGVH